jgi:hypothetical protein
MEELIELVAASFARHGIDCPAADSHQVWGRVPAPVRMEHSSKPIEPTSLPEHNYRKALQGDPAP